MFDQYGTVVDMQGGLTVVAAPYLRSKGWAGDPHSFVTWWRRTHFENSMIEPAHKEHTPYRRLGVSRRLSQRAPNSTQRTRFAFWSQIGG
jgi:2-haloacid dehalogenase